MAATESRTGFRLPWSTEDKATGQREDAPSDADRPSDVAEAPTDEAATAEAATPDATVPSADASPVTEPTEPTTEANEPSTQAVVTEEAAVHPTVTHGVPARSTDAPAKKPSKFLADLTRAMQGAAEASRAATLEQFQAEAKTHIEEVQARSADGATELRKTADDDIVTIRDWSKAELARIREETDRKITTRKADLETELEEHAAQYRAPGRTGPGPGRRVRDRDGSLLREAPERGRSGRVRRDGREPSRAAALRFRGRIGRRW